MCFGKRGVLCFCPWSVAKKVTVIFIMCLWREFCKLEWETVLRWTVFQTLKKICGRNQCLSSSGKLWKWQNRRFYVNCFFLNVKIVVGFARHLYILWNTVNCGIFSINFTKFWVRTRENCSFGKNTAINCWPRKVTTLHVSRSQTTSLASSSPLVCN